MKYSVDENEDGDREIQSYAYPVPSTMIVRFQMTAAMIRFFRQVEYKRWCPPFAYHFIVETTDDEGQKLRFKAKKARRGVRSIMRQPLSRSA